MLRDTRAPFKRPSARARAIARGVPCFLLTWACCAGAGAAVAQVQSTSTVPARESSVRLLTVAEGRAILDVAWQQELPARSVRDCSHLVHEIYANAGYKYPYASSFEIYAGNENFARVKFSRAGDLIAWPGHVGIVVDPLQHSFYSLVRTGQEELNYESPYWRSRGKPRFYRFKVEKEAVLSAAKTSAYSGDPNRPPSAVSARSAAYGPVQSKAASSQAQGPFAMESQDQITAGSPPDLSPTAGVRKTSRIYGPPAPVAQADSPAGNHEEPAPFEMPTSVVVATGSKAPTREEVAEGISEFSDASGSILRTEDPLKAQQPVVVVEQFIVEKVEIKRDHGWARLAVDSRVLIAGGTAHVKRRHEKVRWELRRTDSGWETLPPTDRTYVPHDVAVKNLAAQLARIAVSEAAAQHDETILREEAGLAGILNALLQPK